MASKKRYVVMVICAMITLISAAAIIWFSGQDAGESHTLSKGLTAWVLSLLSMERTEENLDLIDYILRKSAHFGLYFLFGFGLSELVRGQRKVPAAFIVIALGALFAVSDEFHQHFSGGRTPSAWDVALDTLGVAAGWMVFRGLKWSADRRGMGW